MTALKRWWSNDLPVGVKFVFLVLLANGLPAFLILMVLPGMTEILFVWTVKPEINARLLGVMYGNALLLVAFGAFQLSWARVRITMVVITLFSILATVLTFFYLKPFLAHPWFHLAYWLTMYLVLFVAAPYVFITQERVSGGRLPVETPMNLWAKAAASAGMLFSLVCGLGLLFRFESVNAVWPWSMPPLVGGLIGVLFTTHAAAYAWALRDGDWLRVRPVFWQAPITALFLMLLPLIHPGDLQQEGSLALFNGIAGAVVLVFAAVILSHRQAEWSG